MNEDAVDFLREAINKGKIPIEVVRQELALRGYVTVKNSNLLFQCGRCFRKPTFPPDSDAEKDPGEIPVNGSGNVWG